MTVPKPRPARPAPTGGDRVRKSERTRARILDATAELLARKGYAGTRLSEIAELAGVQTPAIYYYVDSRESLVEEVVVEGMVRNLEHVRDALRALPEETGPLERIACAVEAHLEVVLRVSSYAAASIRTSSQLPPDIRDRHLEERRRYGELWRDLLEAARREGALHPDLDVRAARMLVLGALNWACEWWSPGRGSLRSVTRTAQLMVRRGLAAPVATPG